MRRRLLRYLLSFSLVLFGGVVQAEEIICKGSITSVQGEGLIARKHRFEIEGVNGADLNAVIEKCKKLAQEKQNRAARRNPGGAFKPLSELDLQCVQGVDKIAVRRSVRTAP